jgi:hypothetical protein
MPMSELQVVLNILRNEANLQIRYFDPQSDGVAPAVFIETARETDDAVSGNQTNIPDETANEIISRRSFQTVKK